MNRTPLTAAQRLIVAADFDPTGEDRDSARAVAKRVLGLADILQGTGVLLKVNSALRVSGYGLIDDIRAKGVGVFADLKLYDIGNTLATDGRILQAFKPELLTVACSVGQKGLAALKAELPDTEILGVTILTSLESNDVEAVHGGLTLSAAVGNLAQIAAQAGIDGLIASAAEAADIRRLVGPNMTINTPAIRPAWATVEGDDQNAKRTMTPTEAIRAGADRIVVGRPITQAIDPAKAVRRTIEEIEQAIRQG